MPGYYNIVLRASNAGSEPATLGVFVNGVPQGAVSVPPQADADTWVNVSLSLKLAAGNNIITFRRKAEDTGQVAIDHLAVPFWPATVLYEADSRSLLGGATAAASHRNYTAPGFVDHLDTAGSGVLFHVFAPKSGAHTLTTRYANGSGAERSMTLYIDGATVGSAAFAPTADWDTWSDHPSVNIDLAEGPHTITWKLDASDSGGLHLDSLAVEAKAAQ